SLSVDPQSHVSRHGAHLRRPCDRLRRADRLRLTPVGADRDPDAGDRPRGALSRSEVQRRLPPLQNRGSPLALTIPPLPPAGLLINQHFLAASYHILKVAGLANKMAAFSNRLTPRSMQRANDGPRVRIPMIFDAPECGLD